MKFSKMLDTNVNFWGGNFGEMGTTFNCCTGEAQKPEAENFENEEGILSLTKASTKWSESKQK